VARFEPLNPGEPIGVIALSGPVDTERLQRGLAQVRRWDHPLLLAPNLDARWGYLAGEDSCRLDGLEWVLDRGARVLLAARGGYGVSRLLARLPWDRLERCGACVVGFSDLTALVNPLAARVGRAQVHGPMVAAGLARPANARRLHHLLEGKLEGETLLRFGAESVIRPGRATGLAWGGNLSMLQTLLGTPFELDLSEAVLFVEEVDEPAYRLDRMLTHLASSATFVGVKALIFGSLRGCGRGGGRPGWWPSLLLDVAPPGIPVVDGLPFGHLTANMALPLGVPVEVDTGTGRVTWRR
jgi:muramoyltetrapeptide carboxypeptidase